MPKKWLPGPCAFQQVETLKVLQVRAGRQRKLYSVIVNYHSRLCAMYIWRWLNWGDASAHDAKLRKIGFRASGVTGAPMCALRRETRLYQCLEAVLVDLLGERRLLSWQQGRVQPSTGKSLPCVTSVTCREFQGVPPLASRERLTGSAFRTIYNVHSYFLNAKMFVHSVTKQGPPLTLSHGGAPLLSHILAGSSQPPHPHILLSTPQWTYGLNRGVLPPASNYQ